MNDKQQLKEINEEIRQHIKRVMGENQPPVVCRVNLTEEQAKGLAERMPQTGDLRVLDEPPCMAKRIEELEAQVRVMADLLRKSEPLLQDLASDMRAGGYWDEADDVLTTCLYINDCMSGNIPATTAPEGWQLVPVEPTGDMVDASVEEWHNSEAFLDDMNKMIYRAMLAAAPSPDSAK